MLFLPVAAALINTERPAPRQFWIGVGISLVLHALLFMFMPRLTKQEPEAAASGPMVVQLQSPAAAAELVEPRQPAPARPAPRMMTAPARGPQTASVPLQPPPVPETERPRAPVPPTGRLCLGAGGPACAAARR